MANTNAPFGLRPLRHLFGGVIRTNRYNIASAYGTALYTGDPVVVTGTGKEIGIATAGSSGVITGVFAGCEFVDANGDTHIQSYWPAAQTTKGSVAAIAHVYDDPFILFEIQMDTMAAANVRLFTDLVSGTGSASTGLSAWTAAGVAGSENQLKLYALSEGLSGGAPNAYGAYAIAEVLIQNHEMLSDAVEV